MSQAEGQPSEIHTVVGRSLVLEHPDDIIRVSVAVPEVIDAVAASTREVVLNAKSAVPGQEVQPGAAGVDQPFWGGAPARKATGGP